MQKINYIDTCLLGSNCIVAATDNFLHQNCDPMLWVAFRIPSIICIFGIVWKIKEISEKKAPRYFSQRKLMLAQMHSTEKNKGSRKIMKKTKLEICGTRFFGIHYEGDSFSLYNELKDNKKIMMFNAVYEQTMVSEGVYDEFIDIFLDGVKLQKDVDYTSESGSTRITIRSETYFRN